MTSKHYRWQTRWALDVDTATHDTGLQVRFTGGQAEPVNIDAIMPALVAKNGGHNAPIMLQSLIREAGQLHAESHGAHRG